MRSAESRKKALVRAGYQRAFRGKPVPDTLRLATELGIARTSVYAWINGTGGRYITLRIQQALAAHRA